MGFSQLNSLCSPPQAGLHCYRRWRQWRSIRRRHRCFRWGRRPGATAEGCSQGSGVEAWRLAATLHRKMTPASECYFPHQYVFIFINPIRKKGMKKAKNVLYDIPISMIFMGLIIMYFNVYLMHVHTHVHTYAYTYVYTYVWVNYNISPT